MEESPLKRRVALFLLVGGASTGIQFALLWWFIHSLESTLIAIILAVELSVLFNFTLNRFVTWYDRFEDYSKLHSVKGFIFLFILFNMLTPSIWLKLFGIPVVSGMLEIHPITIAVVLEGVGVVINYLLADKLFFGHLSRL